MKVENRHENETAWKQRKKKRRHVTGSALMGRNMSMEEVQLKGGGGRGGGVFINHGKSCSLVNEVPADGVVALSL